MPVQITVVECPRCGGFDNITKGELRKNKTGPQQRYRCGDCTLRFSMFRSYIHQFKDEHSSILVDA